MITKTNATETGALSTRQANHSAQISGDELSAEQLSNVAGGIIVTKFVDMASSKLHDAV